MTPSNGHILLDAGEGTWGQLARFFGTDENKPENVWDVLRDLKCIYISHIHGDHHIGVSKILTMRAQVR
jgi:ribonuclease Z